MEGGEFPYTDLLVAKTEEKNRMGKTTDLFKKIKDTKGIFHAKMGLKRTEMVWT